jgi:hypothetical protein
MKQIGLALLILAAALSCSAQQWEFGGSAGASFLPGVSVTSPYGSATAGFKTGPAFGAYFGQNLYRHFSGELHYEFMLSDEKLSSGSAEATFSGMAHQIHYDLVYHTGQKEGSRSQFFVAVGGGAKLFQGTGTEQAYQPLSQFGYLTKTRQIRPMGDVGVGVKVAITEKVFLRLEARDYITPFPKSIIAPAPGAKFGSFLMDIIPMVGISYEY